MQAVWEAVPTFEAAAYVGRGGEGGSHPILLRIQDGRVVHVKLQHNPQTTRSLASDWIGTLLARGLGAPVPEVVLVSIPFEHLARLPQLKRIRWRPGLQFGTWYVAGARPVDSRLDWRKVQNWSALPLVALVETWLHNQDLKSSHLLLCPAGDGFRLMATDHGFILPGGPGWTVDDLARSRTVFPAPGLLTRLALSVPVRFDFGPALQVCTAVRRQELEALVASVPREWGLSRRRREALVDFLRARRDRLAPVAHRLEALWNHGKGGDSGMAAAKEDEDGG
ncbi:MAG: hypothetical protein K6U14_03305 [Firmicutes bacterium]|nr:hypothetical protein [Alicyclobacillaceae bacterium]MCL6496646.1 hypothetical protein [Bacillota bacterium]